MSILTNVLSIGLSYTDNSYWFLTLSLLGGVSIGGLLTCQDLTLCDVLGNQLAHRSHRLFSTIVGLGVLAFCFVHSTYFVTSIFICALFFSYNFTEIYKFCFFGTRRAWYDSNKEKLTIRDLSNL